MPAAEQGNCVLLGWIPDLGKQECRPEIGQQSNMPRYGTSCQISSFAKNFVTDSGLVPDVASSAQLPL